MPVAVSGENAVADGNAKFQLHAGQARRRLVREDLEVIRLASNDRAQRDEGVLVSRLCHALQREWSLQRSWHPRDGDCGGRDTGFGKRFQGRFEENLSDITIESRDHNANSHVIATQIRCNFAYGHGSQPERKRSTACANIALERKLGRCTENWADATFLIRRKLGVTCHFEVESGHAGHLSRPCQQSHLAYPQIAQNLRADAVVA